jgi:glycerol-3-phosphate dehydrogenase
MKTRDRALADIANKQFDVCVIGGGATGAGCALDSQLRGMRTVTVDAGDFAGATSSASTKIVHGGVRYLEEAVKDLDPAQYRVVTRALHERIRMLRNAPYLCRTMEFLVPCFSWADVAYYDVGLKLYDWVSGDTSIFPSHFVSKDETLRRMPALKSEGLIGAVAYADGQFDDSRYNIALVETFTEAGGEALNYARVVGFEKDQNGRLQSAQIEDQVNGSQFTIQARAFVNATGPVADTVRTLASPGIPPRMRLSKGVHILLPLELMPGSDALLIPKTEDGRVMFAIPWSDRLLVGTTEKEVSVGDELYVIKDEVEYLLHHLNQYLERPASASQVVSGIAGVRPLVSSADSRDTKKLARDHEIEVDSTSGLISIMGGKWTTYRAMAEDTIDAVQSHLGLPKKESATSNYPLAGSEGYMPDYWSTLISEYEISPDSAQHLAAKFGTRASEVLRPTRETPDLKNFLVEGLPVLRAEVVYCIRNEMAVTVEDILFRRTGVQLHSWRAAIEAAAAVAAILAAELGWSAEAEVSAVRQYVAKLNRFLQLAGLDAQSSANQYSAPGDGRR